jgi:hypothetical protein
MSRAEQNWTGVDIESVPFTDVLFGWEPEIIRFFLDHDADALG